MPQTLGRHCYGLLTGAGVAVDNAHVKKPRRTTAEPAQWSVHMMRSKLTYLGSVDARDEAEAMDKAIKQLEIRQADRWRISVQRE
jgi:hypothetical protein